MRFVALAAIFLIALWGCTAPQTKDQKSTSIEKSMEASDSSEYRQVGGGFSKAHRSNWLDVNGEVTAAQSDSLWKFYLGKRLVHAFSDGASLTVTPLSIADTAGMQILAEPDWYHMRYDRSPVIDLLPDSFTHRSFWDRLELRFGSRVRTTLLVDSSILRYNELGVPAQDLYQVRDSLSGILHFRATGYLPNRLILIQKSLYEGASAVAINVHTGNFDYLPSSFHYRIANSDLALFYFSGEAYGPPSLEITSFRDLSSPCFSVDFDKIGRGYPEAWRIGETSFLVLIRCMTSSGCKHGLYRFDISLPGQR